MELKNIAILGAGGNVGTAIINELLKEPFRFNITAILRPSSAYTGEPHHPLSRKTADFSSIGSLTTAFQDQDCIVNCLPGNLQHPESKLITDAAAAANVKLYVANEFVGHITSEQFRRMPESLVGAKVRIREYLEELAREEKIKWTSVNGGPFFDMWLMKGPAGFDVKNKRARIYGSGHNPLFWTPLPTVALAVANILRKADRSDVVNRPVYIAPIPGLTQSAILEALENVLGEGFEMEYVDVKKINENARIALQRGEVGKAMKGLTVSNQFYEADAGNDFSALVTNGVVGVEERSLQDAVRDAIERYGTDCAVVESMWRVEACEV